ncbi:hypothetical protein GALMADRAFT_1169267 [Galerina marginata CBS 339.88]|uniref:Peptidase C14 caspase domain-containing protein n=1 Tax=Galerina marginata (strain CBS 339.88) TaxID=685588 RepID=A0A067T9P0_GALM3|nr:hypothetical protein GALMADRAFT_1169267 [Galerina marginata CBS 339.88]
MSPDPPNPPPLWPLPHMKDTNIARHGLKVATQILGAPIVKERQLERRKLALLIGVGYTGSWKLNGTQHDVESLKSLLEERNRLGSGTHSSKVILLSDKEGTPMNFIPTYRNIMEQLENFISDDEPTDYFFVYAGHSYQREEVVQPGQRTTEEDGLEEYIMPCDAVLPDGDIDDNKTINDKTLHEYLVSRLHKGSHLVALFDSCHSGTLLNLRHHRCNRSGDYISWIQDTGRRVFFEPINTRFSRRSAPLSGDIAWPNPWGLRNTNTGLSMDSQTSSDSQERPPLPWRTTKCTGFCPRRPSCEEPQVVSISACKDSQIVIESDAGGPMIQAIVEELRKFDEPTYEEVMSAAREKIEAMRKVVVDHQKALKKAKKCSWPFPWHWHCQCFTEADKAHRELAKTKADPQLSSRKSFNTKRTIFRI